MLHALLRIEETERAHKLLRACLLLVLILLVLLYGMNRGWVCLFSLDLLLELRDGLGEIVHPFLVKYVTNALFSDEVGNDQLGMCLENSKSNFESKVLFACIIFILYQLLQPHQLNLTSGQVEQASVHRTLLENPVHLC